MGGGQRHSLPSLVSRELEALPAEPGSKVVKWRDTRLRVALAPLEACRHA